jgi:hypothetical protein
MVTAIPMKFCKRRKIDYKTPFNVETSSHYVTEKDILDFHGPKFTEQWKILARHKNASQFGEDIGFFYDDYQHYARATDSFLNPKG